jgi:group I intron endonuclease
MYYGVSGIYAIQCKVNNKIYIGQSVNIGNRFKNHLYLLRHNRHGNKYLQNAWNKHGEENFKFHLIKEFKHDNLDFIEKFLICKLRTANREYGYNIESGGNKNKIISQETRDKISKANKGKKGYWLGKHLSDETKEKIRQANIGKKLSQETKDKLSKKSKGRFHTDETKEYLRSINIGENNPMYGKEPWNKGGEWSEEHKRKLSEAKQGEKNNRYGTKHTEETKRKMSDSNPNKVAITEEMRNDKLNGMKRKDWLLKYGYSTRIWYKINIKEQGGTV